MKRLLDCTASDFFNMTGQDLKQSIKASEGRTMLAETMATVPPLYPDVTNAELTASFGADLLLFNVFDVFNPEVMGFTPSNPEQVIHEIKHLTGRPVGLNLEPVDLNAEKLKRSIKSTVAASLQMKHLHRRNRSASISSASPATRRPV